MGYIPKYRDYQFLKGNGWNDNDISKLYSPPEPKQIRETWVDVEERLKGGLQNGTV